MEFETQVTEILQNANIPFRKKVSLQGIPFDFLIEAPNGRIIALDAKLWEPNSLNKNVAMRRALLSEKATDVDRAFVVMKNLKRGSPAEGLVSVHELVSILNNEIESGGSSERKIARVAQEPKYLIFSAMPFSEEYEDTYFLAMAPAAESMCAVCRRVDGEDFEGDIVLKIKDMIKKSVVVISDLSESKPNVLYETGFAHGLDIPTIHICSTPLDGLPFDVRNWNTIGYKSGQVHKLRKELENRLKEVLKQ